MERIRVSMVDWTEVRERSVTSRQVEAREGETSASVRGCLEEEEGGFVNDLLNLVKDLRMSLSDFRRFWKGTEFGERWDVLEDLAVTVELSSSSVSVSEWWSARRRFPLSAMRSCGREVSE